MSAPPLLTLANVTIAYGGLIAVRDASLTIMGRTTVGLVGESGSGKTSLGKAIVGLTTFSGSIHFAGEDVGAQLRRDRRGFARAVQLLFQDPLASLSPRLTVRALLNEPAVVHGLDRREAEARLSALTARTGLGEDLFTKYPHELSGGQGRRVALVRALMVAPTLLVCDEPTAGLDVSVQGEVLNLLNDLQREHALTYLVISHNLAVIRRVTDVVAVMYLGRIVESAPTAALFARPAHPYTAALIAAMPAIDPARRCVGDHVLPGEIPSPFAPPPGCAFHTRCPKAQARCRSEAPAYRALDVERAVACHFPEV